MGYTKIKTLSVRVLNPERIRVMGYTKIFENVLLSVRVLNPERILPLSFLE